MEIPIQCVQFYYLVLSSTIAKGRILKTDCYNEAYSEPLSGGVINNIGVNTDWCELIECDKKTIDNAPKNLKITHGDIRDLPFDDFKFDTILDLSTIDHIPFSDMERVISGYDRVLNINGNILVIVWCAETEYSLNAPENTKQYYVNQVWFRNIFSKYFDITHEERFHTSHNGYLVAFIGRKK